MNIVYVCADRGIPVLGAKGASVHVRSITAAMQRLGHRVTLVARCWGEGNPAPAVHRLEELESAPADAAVQLGQLIRAERAEMVIERYSLESGAARVATRECGIPLTLEVNARLVEEATRYRDMNDPAAEQREIETLRAADSIQVVSSALLRHVRRVAPGVPAIWIPNGAEVGRFRAAATTAPSAKAEGPIVGFTGSMKPWHGVEQLLDAFAQVRRAHPRTQLVLVGTGPRHAAVLERSEQPDLRGAVRCTGQVAHAEVPAILTRFAVAVAPYLPLDGFYFHPLKVVEYLAAGLPVVYSDQGDLAELVGSAGLAYAPGAVDQLSDRLSRILSDGALREELASAAARRGTELDWSAIAERVIRFAAGAAAGELALETAELALESAELAGETVDAGAAPRIEVLATLDAERMAGRAALSAPAAPLPASSEERVNPYVVVVGAARSGTTLLQRMLDAHPQLAVVNETYWLPRKFRERTGLTRSGLVTPALFPLLLESPKFARMGMSEADLASLFAAENPVSYADFVSRIFDLYAARRDKPLAGAKTPGYVRRMLQLHELWPRGRFIHIIRDPRDVCLSMLDWSSGERTAGQFGTWAIDPAVSTALYWRLSVSVGREAGEVIGPSRYHEVRYEDLVSATAAELERICAFLDLPYAEEMARFYEGRTRVKPGRSSKAQWLPPTVKLRDWEVELSDAEIERIEAALGPQLAGFGYPARFTEFGEAARRLVAEAHEIFTRHALAAARTLPRDWSC